jgi:endonuclease/exonuclease/phosphatase family metal-dependent hydrolase
MSTHTLTLKIQTLYKDNLGLYRYDDSKEEWRCVKNNIKDECFAFLPTDISINKDELKLVSYNIWGALKDTTLPLFAFDIRSDAVNDLLREQDADIIFLQEVSEQWLDYLQSQDWIRKNYYCTEKNGKRITTTFGISNVIFSKLPLANVTAYGLLSMQMDEALYVETIINNQHYYFITSQLHSTEEFRDFRIMQLETIFNLLLKDKQNAIFIGDYNFGDGEKWIENDYLDKSYTDAYRVLYPKEDGFTEDTHINEMRYMVKEKHKQERFDKMLFRSDKLIVDKFEIFGKEHVGTVKYKGKDVGIWPSDHFGISIKLTIK